MVVKYSQREQELNAVLRQVRTCFNQLRMLAENLHRDLGLNPSMRAVMEALAADQPLTVPDIARSKGVSRQHIQNIMNALQTDGFVEPVDNPAHRRSPLFELTARGREAFEAIREREREPLRRLAESLSCNEMRQAGAAISKLNKYLGDEIARGDNDE